MCMALQKTLSQGGQNSGSPTTGSSPMPVGGSRPQRTFPRYVLGWFWLIFFSFSIRRKLLGLGESAVGFPSLRNDLLAPGFQICYLRLVPESGNTLQCVVSVCVSVILTQNQDAHKLYKIIYGSVTRTRLCTFF